jgi:hypothetical protein
MGSKIAILQDAFKFRTVSDFKASCQLISKSHQSGFSKTESYLAAVFFGLRISAYGRLRTKSRLKSTLDSVLLSGRNQPSTPESEFDLLRPDTEVRQAIFSIALKEVLA